MRGILPALMAGDLHEREAEVFLEVICVYFRASQSFPYIPLRQGRYTFAALCTGVRAAHRCA